MNLEIPEPKCKTCGKVIPQGKPFCYECGNCKECSPECFLEDLEKFLEKPITAKEILDLEDEEDRVYYKILKKGAIKCIKYYIEEAQLRDTNYLLNKADGLMEFFSITDEDLMEDKL